MMMKSCSPGGVALALVLLLAVRLGSALQGTIISLHVLGDYVCMW